MMFQKLSLMMKRLQKFLSGEERIQTGDPDDKFIKLDRLLISIILGLRNSKPLSLLIPSSLSMAAQILRLL